MSEGNMNEEKEDPHLPEKHFAEDFGLFMEHYGLPRMAGRVLGWLLICDPPHQSMDDLAEALQASKGSISGATQLLVQRGQIKRVSLPGHRRTYYCVDPDAWQQVIKSRMPVITEMRKLAEHGLELLGNTSPKRLERLTVMRDTYAFFEEDMLMLLRRWEKEIKRG